MIRKFVFLIMLLLCLNYVYASSREYAKIEFTVINQAPEISSLTINPNQAYYDSTLECLPVTKDESPETVKIEYAWYKNDVLLEDKTKTLSDLNDNDNVTCSATPIDSYGKKGESEKAQIKILESSFTTKLMKPLLNIAGVNTSAKELNSGTNLNAITGMVTGQNKDSGITLVFLLGIFAMILVGLNLVGLSKKSFSNQIK